MAACPSDVGFTPESVAKLVDCDAPLLVLVFRSLALLPSSEGDYQTTHARAYEAHAAIDGGGRQRNLASRLRFCPIAVSKTSSLAPLKPRNRSRSSLRMRFIWANRISTFLRSRRDCWKAAVLASARTRSRTSSLRSRVILRATAVVHFGFSKQTEQSFLLAR